MPALPPPRSHLEPPRGIGGTRGGAAVRRPREGPDPASAGPTAGLHSRCASGPRSAAPRLAGPIDSLVRVSRRVGEARDFRPRTRGARDGRPRPSGADAADTEDCLGGRRPRAAGRPRPAKNPAPLRERAGRARPVVPSSVGSPAQPRPGSRSSRPAAEATDRRRRRRRPVRRYLSRPASAGVRPRPVAGADSGRSARRRRRAGRPGRGLRRPAPRGTGRRGEPVRGPAAAAFRRIAESPGFDLRGPPVCFSAASRTLELSLQSAFQLSLTVLVLYRSRAGV